MRLENKIDTLFQNVKVFHRTVRQLQHKYKAQFDAQTARQKVNNYRAKRLQVTKPGLFRRSVQLTGYADRRLKNINAELNQILAGIRNWELQHGWRAP